MKKWFVQCLIVAGCLSGWGASYILGMLITTSVLVGIENQVALLAGIALLVDCICFLKTGLETLDVI